ncbi:4-coumarate-CoA ligase [Eremomyces bilateralis CBS 781.70]|uniref:4-coumarate-CoA ligase n=1 Tax=Eremomyces bilateralis CBS 781.70 TaxID=1392243 RepID=A0A6G1FXN5_9PEZI|nr:4-coumarate-CoA ligase [Eremomyces bilateralis CBS 781.70]KAF1810597.1 4-coumarate-CoA ligase [Eremomyces bilateralis CBS 781.70]
MAPKIYYGERYYAFPQMDMLTFLFESQHALSQPDTQLHIDAANPSNYLTKSTTISLTEQFAHAFRTRFGIGAAGPNHDVVVGFSSLQILLPVAFYGTVAAGGVFSAASHSFTPAELARQVTQGDAKLLITSADLVEVAVEAAGICGLGLDRVLVLESDAGKWGMRSVDGSFGGWTEERLMWERVTDPVRLEESLIILLYSSGTTGAPKGVRLSHQNVVASTYNPSQAAREWAFPRVMSGEIIPSPQRTIAHLPAAHIAGVSGYFISPVYSGTSLYWMRKYEWKKFLEYNKQHQITGFFSVPAIYARIAKSADVTDQFASFEGGLGGAAPMDDFVQTGSQKKLADGSKSVGGTWGLSEATGSVTSLPRGLTDTTGSVGTIHPNMQLRLVDDDDQDVPEGQPGEAIIRGPTITKGYHDNPEATKEAFLDGWFRTGDILQQRNGLWYVTDRKKELIKYKGLQVAPAELEGLLLSHPFIEDAAVIGVPFEGTEAPRAYVVADRKKLSEEEVKQFIASKLSPHKQLRGGVVYMEAIPRSTVGKILRRELREAAKKENKAKL